MMTKTSSDITRKVCIDFLWIFACLMVILNRNEQLGDIGFFQFLSCTSGDIRLGTFSMEETLYGILKTEYTDLWYLYTYIAFLIPLPFPGRIIKGLELTSSIYMLNIAFLISGVLKCFEYSFISINPNLVAFWITVNIFVCMVTGNRIDKYIDVKKLSNKVSIFICCILTMCLLWPIYREYDIQVINSGDVNEKYMTAFSLAIAVVFFILAKKWNERSNKRIDKAIVET